MGKGRILVVEDDFDISNMLRIYFTGQGYDVQVAPRGGDALTLTRRQLPQLIVLDIMLPDMNGYEVCRELRSATRTSHIPVIVLTQKDERSDKIAGLELGADDYITKPFRLRELLVRMRAVLRRAAPQEAGPQCLVIGEITLDRGKHEVRKQNQVIDLTPLEFQILEILMQSAGQVVQRAALSMRLMENGYTGSESTLKIHIHNLREKLEDDLNEPRYIETVFGVGYRFLETAE